MDERVDALQRRAAADPRAISLGGGLPSGAQFPRRELARSFLRVLGEAGAPALQYGWAEGSEHLRAFVAARLRARGADVRAEQVIVTSGAQQAIAIALEIACRPGDRVAVEPETYPAALDLLRTRRLVPVAAVGEHRPAGLLRAAYVMPALSNPRGGSLADADRRALLGSGMAVVEDDAYADLRFDGPAPRALYADAPAQVFHVGTLSKTLCPGMRIGWLVPPPRHLRRALRIKHDSDLQSSSLAQAIASDYLGRVDFDERLCRLRRFYARRAQRLAHALRATLPGWRFSHPEGGFSIWVEADGLADETELLAEATRQGVSFDPGSLFRPTGRHRPLALRLCFSAAAGPALVEAVQRLARAFDRVRHRRESRAG
jgi:2-aminoadipate transaminase